MFTSNNIPCAVKSVALKIEKGDEHELKVAHVTCVVEPFTPELAIQLGSAIYAHLFTRNPERPDVEMPRPELVQIGLNVACGLQRISARSHPDLPIESVLKEARVTNIRVTRPDPDAPRLSLSFVLSLSMDRRDTLVWVVQAFARVNYLSFLPEQLDLISGRTSADVDDAFGARRRMRDTGITSATIGDTTFTSKDVTGKSATACEHGVEHAADQVCEACEAEAKSATAIVVESLTRKGFLESTGGASSPADIQAAGARKGREKRAGKKQAGIVPTRKGWGAALKGGRR